MKHNTCPWATSSPLMQEYHDTEWGNPVHDDNRLFEFLILEGMQAGLSWSTILNKRECFRITFDHFNPQKISSYGEEKIAELLQEPGIIRNKLKIRAAITNAKAFIQVQKEYGSFDAYIWSFVNNTPIINRFTTIAEIPTATPLAHTISKDLKKKGFTFVGPVIIYSFMQAIGIVCDHLTTCELSKKI